MTGPMGIDLPTLDRMAGDLDSAAAGLEQLTSPAGVDAGPMSTFIMSLLAHVTNSAGEVSRSATATAGAVRLSARYYRRADSDAEATFEQMRTTLGEEA